MDEERFERQLRQARLSSPRVTLGEVRQRIPTARDERRPSGLTRLALAAALVWIAAWATEAAVEHSLQTVAPLSPAAMAVEGRNVWPPLARDEMWEALSEEGWYADEPPEPEANADTKRSSDVSYRRGRRGHV